jgi:hypothetical protein
MIKSEQENRTLATLARAINFAPRRDYLPIWRAFVMRARS